MKGVVQTGGGDIFTTDNKQVWLMHELVTWVSMNELRQRFGHTDCREITWNCMTVNWARLAKVLIRLVL